MNEFLKFKRNVLNAKENYLKAKQFDITEGNRESILRLAKPFERGYFTLAVIGGMSAGKSSFLNAFLGEKDLLPTGGDQTTCILTSIGFSKKQSVTIKYRDSLSNTFSAKDINELKNILKEKVAIPHEYGNGFPILQINNDIITGLSESQILEKLPEYEALAQRPIEDDLKKYLSLTMGKRQFVENVFIGLDVKLLEGWQIVDTPGVCALGGIEEITSDFLLGKDIDGYDNVDAILFIYNGSQSLQEKPELTSFIRDVVKRNRSFVAERSFMIITHSASGSFRSNSDYIKNAKQQIQNIIPDDHIFYIDNNLELFCKERENCPKDFKDLINKDYLSQWDEDTARVLKGMKMDLLDEGKSTLCNEDFINKINELSQFTALREKLDEFIVQQKQKAYEEIIDLIKKDLNNLANRKKEAKAMVEGDLKGQQDMATQLRKREEDRKKRHEDFNIIANTLATKYNEYEISQEYDEIRRETHGLKCLKAKELDYKTEEIGRNLEEKRASIINKVKSDCQHQFDSIVTDFTFPTLDLKAIVEEARHKNTELKPKEGLLNYFKRKFSKLAFWVKDKKPEDWGQAWKEDSEKVAEECQDIIREAIKDEIALITNIVRTFIVEVDNSIKRYNELIKRSEDELRENTRTINDKEQTISKLKNEISQIENSLNCI